MTKICVIGNSHLAALKLGWDQIKADHPQVDITFIGAPGNHMEDLRVRDGKVFAGNPSLKYKISKLCKNFDEIKISDFDQFIIVGSNFGIGHVAYAFGEASTVDLGPTAGKLLVSEPVFKLGLAGRLRSAFGWRIAQAIRHEPGSHSVRLVPAPHPSVSILEDPSDKKLPKIYANIMKSSAAGLLHRYYADVLEELSSEVEIASQPQSTIDRLGLTKSEFSRGSVFLTNKLDQGHGENEHLHMNGAYGAALLTELLS